MKKNHFGCSCGEEAPTLEELDEHYCSEILPDAEYRWQ